MRWGSFGESKLKWVRELREDEKRDGKVCSFQIETELWH